VESAGTKGFSLLTLQRALLGIVLLIQTTAVKESKPVENKSFEEKKKKDLIF